MVKREVKRIRNKLGSMLDPIAIIGMLLLLLLPTLTVMNLSPRTKGSSVNDRNVLGEQDNPNIGVVLVGGIHDYMKEELLDFPAEGIFRYRNTIIAHEKGRYSKPILQIVNNSSDIKDVSVSAILYQPSNTEVSLILDEKEYILVSKQGEPFTHSIKLDGKSDDIAYLKFASSNKVSFNNTVEVQIVQK